LEILHGLREKVAQKQISVNIDDFRKRAALADQLIAGLTERLGALERSRRGKQETKGGQIFSSTRGETKDGDRVVKYLKDWALKAQKQVPGLLLHSGATMVDETHYETFVAWESNSALINYLTEQGKQPGVKEIHDAVTSLQVSVFGSVTKAAKEAIAASGYNPTYLEFNGFIRS